MMIEVQEAEALEVEVLQDLMDEDHQDRWVKVQAAEARLEMMMMTSAVGEALAAHPDLVVLEVVVLEEKVQAALEEEVLMEMMMTLVVQTLLLHLSMMMTLEVGVAPAVLEVLTVLAVLAVLVAEVQMGPVLTALMDLVDVDPLVATLGAMMATTVIHSTTTMALRLTRVITIATSSAMMEKMQTTFMTTSSGVKMKETPMITALITPADSASATKILKGGGATSMADEICKPREDPRSRTTQARATSTGVLMGTIPRKIASMTGTPPTSRRTPSTTTG